MRRTARWVLVVLSLAALAACTNEADTPVEHGPTAAQVQALDDRAAKALNSFAAATAGKPAAVFVPVGEPFGELGSWEPNNRDLAASLAALRVVGLWTRSTPAPKAPHPTARVTWADGSAATLPMLSADEAFTSYPDAPLVPCFPTDCRQLKLIGGVLVESTVATTRGPATAPVWVYEVVGSTVRLTRPAVGVPLATVPSLPQPSTGQPYPFGASGYLKGPQYQLPVLGARASLTAPSLTGTVPGLGPNGDQPCGADYAAEAIESVTAVVLVVHEARHLNLYPHAICDLLFYPRLVTVTLHQPLGNRTVLDGVSGQPVPTVRTP